MFAVRRKSDRAFAGFTTYATDDGYVEVSITFGDWKEGFAVFREMSEALAVIDPSTLARGEHLRSLSYPSRDSDFLSAIAADDVEIVDLTPAT
jgi:hypothetical protein